MTAFQQWMLRSRNLDNPDSAAEFARRAFAESSGRAFLRTRLWHGLAAELVEPGAPAPIHLVDGSPGRAAADREHRRCMLAPRWLVTPIGTGGEVSPASGMLRVVPGAGPRGRLQASWTVGGEESPLVVVNVGVALSAVVGHVVAEFPLALAVLLQRGDVLTVPLPAHRHAQLVWREMGEDVFVAPAGTPADLGVENASAV